MDIKNLIRVGLISSINPDNMTAKVIFPDKDDMLSGDLKIVNRGSAKNKCYWLPDIEEQVLCVMNPNSKNLNDGWIVGSYFSDVDAPPISDLDKCHFVFQDGSFFEYDRKNHVLTIDIKGEIDIKASGNIKINGKIIYLN